MTLPPGLRPRLWLPPGYEDVRGGPPSLVLVTLEIGPVSPQGRPLAPPYRQWSHSWVKQMAQFINCEFQDSAVGTASETGVLDTGNVSRTLTSNASRPLGTGAAAADATHGVLLGTSAQAESRDDYNLIAQIAEGAGAGQLNHLVSNAYTPVAAVTGGYRVTVDRQVNNNSGGDIVVAEIGLVVLYNRGGVSQKFLLLRDVLSSTYSIANGASAVGRYKIDWLV